MELQKIIKKINYADIFPVYKRFLNPCSLGALYLTKSLFKDGIGGMIKHKRPNADTLTISSIVSSILLGNSSSALTIILFFLAMNELYLIQTSPSFVQTLVITPFYILCYIVFIASFNFCSKVSITNSRLSCPFSSINLKSPKTISITLFIHLTIFSS